LWPIGAVARPVRRSNKAAIPSSISPFEPPNDPADIDLVLDTTRPIGLSRVQLDADLTGTSSAPEGDGD
jgi:hypothetical protein